MKKRLLPADAAANSNGFDVIVIPELFDDCCIELLPFAFAELAPVQRTENKQKPRFNHPIKECSLLHFFYCTYHSTRLKRSMMILVAVDAVIALIVDVPPATKN